MSCGRRGQPKRAAGEGTDDAVGHQPVAALEALDGAFGVRPEDTVGRNPELLLDLRTAEPRWPRLTTTSLEAVAPPALAAPGSASPDGRGGEQRPARAPRKMRTTNGVEDPSHLTFPLSSAYEVS